MSQTRSSSFGVSQRINHNADAFYKSNLYANCTVQDKPLLPDNELPPELRNSLIQGDAANMQQLPDRCVHLMVTSPPYNVLKEYDEDMPLDEYLLFLHGVMKDVYRVLVDGGRACINIANLGRKPYLPLSDLVSSMMISLGFSMRGEIIWLKGAGAGVSMAWGSWQSATNPVLRDTHEYILVFTKGSYKRVMQPHQENTISKDEFMDWTKSVWEIRPESAKRVGHPAPFPLELPNRLIQLYSFTHDVVLDPFVGSGTTAIAAYNARRIYVGYDISNDYLALAKRRLSECLP